MSINSIALTIILVGGAVIVGYMAVARIKGGRAM